MRILLPPSEAKNPGGRGRALADRTAPAGLADGRAQVWQALQRALSGPDPAAALALPPSVVETAVAENARALTAPTLPAMRRYSGVVYDGLAVTALSDRAQRLAGRSLLIFSGLFGVLRGDEPTPAYRVPAKAVLPGVGVAGTFWRPLLAEVMPTLLDSGPIVDLRSTDYAAMWQPAGAVRDRLVAVRVLSTRPNGTLGVISYNSKLAKGRLAAALLEREVGGGRVTGADDITDVWASLGGRDAVRRDSKSGVALDLIG